MKKIMLSVALLTAVVLTSCGKTACECLKEGMDIERKSLKLKRKLRGMSSSSATVTAKLKELRAEADDLDSKCKGFTVEQYEKCKGFTVEQYEKCK